MGGRGGSSGMSKSAVEPKVQSLEQYLGKRGLNSPISDYMSDKMRIPHGLTRRQNEKMLKEATQARNDYAAKRNAAIDAYNNEVAAGRIRKPTTVERLLRHATGHEDNSSTQAARRALAKRGIDWKTGKKLKK